MEWQDIASIIFVCVTMNHLGLVNAVEQRIGFRLPVVNCPKCLSCWCTLLYMLMLTEHSIITSLAMSFLASYMAIWLELYEGYIDHLFEKAYDKIYSTADDASATADVEADTAGRMP